MSKKADTEQTTCPSCGYIRAAQTMEVDHVTRYKSGKRKGEIKEATKEDVKFEIGELEFDVVYIMSGMRQTHSALIHERFKINVCPKCRTMIFNDWIPDEA